MLQLSSGDGFTNEVLEHLHELFSLALHHLLVVGEPFFHHLALLFLPVHSLLHRHHRGEIAVWHHNHLLGLVECLLVGCFVEVRLVRRFAFSFWTCVV